MEKIQSEIIEKVSQIYQKYGVKSVTMDDVSRELGISKKTLYQYFSDKDNLVGSVVDHYIHRHLDKFEEIGKQKLNAIDTLLAISKHVSQFLGGLNPSLTYDIRKYHPEAWKVLTDHKRVHIYDKVVANLNQGIREGLYRDDLHVDIVARLYVSRIEASMDQDIFPGNEYAPPDIFMEIFRYHTRGIASRKGLDYLDQQSQ